jgi:flagellar biosynthesis protein FlhG
VGKSLVAANLAVALGQAGRRVVLADLDLGASNLHVALGYQAPTRGIGAFLAGQTRFEDLPVPTDYENVTFIAGDAEIPGLTALRISQKNDIIKKLRSLEADFLIIDLGAGSHLTILDLFLMSPQGIIVAAPTVTATLNGYLFLKNALFRLMYTSFKRNSRAYGFLENLKTDAQGLQRLYIPKLIDAIAEVDGPSVELLKKRIGQFFPRLILNQLDDPRDAEKALKIRRSCQEYLGVALEHLGVLYRDSMQDRALASRLPVVVYKPQSILAQAIYRIAEKLINSETRSFTGPGGEGDSFRQAEEEAEEDYLARMSYIEDLLGTGALTTGELAEAIRSQHYEITHLKKENHVLKSKILKAHKQGYKL